MLNIPRLRDVLKKLETTSDLARSLIKRASVAIDGSSSSSRAIDIVIDKEHSVIPPDFASPSSLFTQTIVTSQCDSLDSASTPITTLSKLGSYSHSYVGGRLKPLSTATPGTNEIKLMMMMYNNNNNSNNNSEHEKHQPQTIRAVFFNGSLFSRAVSNGSVGSAQSNFRIVREKGDQNTNTNNNQSSDNMSETKLKEEVVVMTDKQNQDGETTTAATAATKVSCNGASCGGSGSSDSSSKPDKHEHTAGGKEKSCFNSSLADILHFMELVGNLKHTKRTGWVLRDVNDCESISGHMYRMSMMTFLLEETEGLNRIRCMELALVHDLAESLVGDLTPFCGVAKEDKKAMELKAMADICKLVEPRGKRIMELFEEYEEGESAESKFVKDLDRLDMVMQAFEYEKRDNCLMKHQEFFDSTEGKFQHPFIKKLVKEICDQRKSLVEANVVAKGELNLKTVTPNCPPCLEHKNERS